MLSPIFGETPPPLGHPPGGAHFFPKFSDPPVGGISTLFPELGDYNRWISGIFPESCF